MKPILDCEFVATDGGEACRHPECSGEKCAAAACPRLEDAVKRAFLAETGQLFDLAEYIRLQNKWSEHVFGEGRRTEGLCRHIALELEEIRAAPSDLEEWIDVIILALDGAWRTGAPAEAIIEGLRAKQGTNFTRRWPANPSPDEPTEHMEGEDE